TPSDNKATLDTTTSPTTGHATCKRGNSRWARARLMTARGGPLKGLFNARMNPRGVIQPPDLFPGWPSPVFPSSSAVVSTYDISRFHDILDVLHHDDHFVSIARAT